MVGGGTNSLNISRRFKYQISSQVSPKPTGRLTDCSNLSWEEGPDGEEETTVGSCGREGRSIMCFMENLTQESIRESHC